MCRALTAACAILFIPAQGFAAEVAVIDNGQPRVAIFAPARLMDDRAKNPEPASIWTTLKAEDNRRRLRESVRDLAEILGRIVGAKVEVVTGKPAADDKRIPILIGEFAEEVFGKPQKAYPVKQGFRLVVTPKAIGLVGESDLATSYAIYTLLEQIGCRWFMPSALGEVLPAGKTITIAEQDLSTGPTTVCRGIWYADSDYGRRNRLGGLLLNAGHALEYTVPKELRQKHPEIKAIINGKPHDHLLKWTHPLVAEALANAALETLKKDPETRSISLSPDDGASWDESDDRKYDAGDFDPAAQTISKSDRLMVVANRVAEKVCAKHPEVKFGILAYVDYTRPPVREKVHPNVIPQIAPITFSRAQPMTDDGEPNNKAFRGLVEGWGKTVPATSYYFYGFYLAETASPNPMITKWGTDIPYIYTHGKCQYWQPETIANFDTSMHALYLGLRMAWNNTQEPKAIIDELHEKFYGGAGRAMADYWHFIDDAWAKTPEYAGCGFGHLRRFTVGKMSQARMLIDKAAAACKTDAEKARVKIASDSFSGFEKFMQLRRDLADGKFQKLAADAAAYRDFMLKLGETHQPQYAFTRMGWTGKSTLNVIYFDSFYKATYDDATRVAEGFQIVSQPPIRTWKIQRDQDKKGEAEGWMKPAHDDSKWKTTDCAVDTWSALGFHNVMGAMWYRTTAELPELPSGKKLYLWLGATDGSAKLFVNGQHIAYVNAKGQKSDAFTGYCQPASFDITAAAGKERKLQIALLCNRETMNELGTGGLIAPLVLYREK